MLWVVYGEVSDDPAWFSYEAVVVAPSPRRAKVLGGRAMLDAYRYRAGGYSLKPRVYNLTVEPTYLPNPEGVMSVEEMDRR